MSSTSSFSVWGHFAWNRRLYCINSEWLCRNNKVCSSPSALSSTVSVVKLNMSVVVQVPLFVMEKWAIWSPSPQTSLHLWMKSLSLWELDSCSLQNHAGLKRPLIKQGLFLLSLLKTCQSSVWTGLVVESRMRKRRKQIPSCWLQTLQDTLQLLSANSGLSRTVLERTAFTEQGWVSFLDKRVSVSLYYFILFFTSLFCDLFQTPVSDCSSQVGDLLLQAGGALMSDVALQSHICEFCQAVFPGDSTTKGEFLRHLCTHVT